jgi:hypothetical protein
MQSCGSPQILTRLRGKTSTGEYPAPFAIFSKCVAMLLVDD